MSTKINVSNFYGLTLQLITKLEYILANSVCNLLTSSLLHAQVLLWYVALTDGVIECNTWILGKSCCIALLSLCQKQYTVYNN